MFWLVDLSQRFSAQKYRGWRMLSEPNVVDLPEVSTATIHLTIPLTEMHVHMDAAIQEILQVVMGQNAQVLGPLMAYHHRMPTDSFDFEIGFPIGAPITEQGRVKNSIVPASKAMTASLTGPYEQLPDAWRQFMARVDDSGHSKRGTFCETYSRGPESTTYPEEFRTDLTVFLL
ncbi:MAG TPA: GyrI-like domain-containing protein [Chlorobiota bacterium]|nr:GyrI-like domain-containing protein [Chlorobiota bacterium]